MCVCSSEHQGLAGWKARPVWGQAVPDLLVLLLPGQLRASCYPRTQPPSPIVSTEATVEPRAQQETSQGTRSLVLSA